MKENFSTFPHLVDDHDVPPQPPASRGQSWASFEQSGDSSFRDHTSVSPIEVASHLFSALLEESRAPRLPKFPPFSVDGDQPNPFYRQRNTSQRSPQRQDSHDSQLILIDRPNEGNVSTHLTRRRDSLLVPGIEGRDTFYPPTTSFNDASWTVPRPEEDHTYYGEDDGSENHDYTNDDDTSGLCNYNDEDDSLTSNIPEASGSSSYCCSNSRLVPNNAQGASQYSNSIERVYS